MIQKHIAQRFHEAADILEIQGANPFRVRAYRRGAQSLENYGGDLAAMVAAKELDTLAGIGKDLAQKIEEFLSTGTMEAIDKLRASIEPGLLDMLEISGMGPKSVKQLHEALKIVDIDSLEKAARQEKIRSLPGFGAKKEEKILKGIQLYRQGLERMSLAMARSLAQTIIDYLKSQLNVKRIEAAGSLRRSQETVGDIDILIQDIQSSAVVECLKASSFVSEITHQGPTKISFLTQEARQIDIRMIKEESYGAALQYFTGSKEHNVALRERAIQQGLRLNEYGLFDQKTEVSVAGKDEAALYARLGLDWVPPELRQGTDEINQAESHSLPELVEAQDIQADFHTHTDWSDGKDALETMLEGAVAQGYAYYVVTDHSQSLRVANGLSNDRLAQQIERIHALKKRKLPLTVLAGAEVDILNEGELDYPDDLLAQLDFVVASIHTGFAQSEKQMTHRIIQAMEHPCVNVIGHPTGRLVNQREPYAIDFSAICRAAVRTQTALEINGSAKRMDLNDQLVRAAKKFGVTFVLSTDAHALAQLDQMPNGLGMARRAGLEPKDLLNCFTLKQLKSWVRKKRTGNE